MAQIHEAIAAIMGEVGSIKKDRTNSGQGYKFRGIDDVYLAIHDLFVKFGVFSVPTVEDERSEERMTKSGTTLIYRVLKIRYDFFAKDGSSLSATVIGEGMDSGDKASNKAMSVAHKYAILQLLAIPTEDTVDPENDNHELTPKMPPTSSRRDISLPQKPQGESSAGILESFTDFVVLVNNIVPSAERPEWMNKGKADKSANNLAALATEIKARYTGKVA
jgi:hypothetical protein